MTTASYDVVLTGEIIPERDKDEVVAALVELFKLTPELATGLLQGKPRRIKAGLSEAEAKRYLTALHKAGARTRVICQGAATLQTPARQDPEQSSDASEVISEVAKQTGEAARPLEDTPVVSNDDGASRFQQVASRVRQSTEDASEVAKLITDTLDRIRKAAAQPASGSFQNVGDGEQGDEARFLNQTSPQSPLDDADDGEDHQEPSNAESNQVTDDIDAGATEQDQGLSSVSEEPVDQSESESSIPDTGVSVKTLELVTETDEPVGKVGPEALPVSGISADTLELVAEADESAGNVEPEASPVSGISANTLELVTETEQPIENTEPESSSVSSISADTLELVTETEQPVENTEPESSSVSGISADTLELVTETEQPVAGSEPGSAAIDGLAADALEPIGKEPDITDTRFLSDAAAQASERQTVDADSQTQDELIDEPGDDEQKLALSRKLSLVATIAVAMLPPVLYTGIIAALAYVSWWHALHDMHWFQSTNGMVMKSLMMTGYGLLLAAGPALILLLLRPLIALFTAPSQGCLLDMDKHQQLRELVDQVAEITEAPVPAEIWVDGELNVASSAQSGPGGMFRDDFVLTIGLPAFTGMQARQLAGLMAREFSYYRHRLSTLSHLVAVQTHGTYRRLINHRDALDRRLQAAIDNRTGAIRVLLRVVVASLGLGRWTLGLMSRASAAMIRLLNRGLDREADLMAASLVGAEVYRSAFQCIEELSLAGDKVDAELDYLMQDGKYPDNLQPLLSRFLRELTDEERGQAVGALSMIRAIPGSIAPATARRIADAMPADDEVQYTQNKPAWQLLVGYESVARAYTLLYYRAQLGPEFSADRMMRAAQVLRQAEERTAGNEALETYLPNLYSAGRHVVPATINARRAGVATIKAKMEELIRELRVQLPVYEKVAGRVAVLNKQLAEARAGLMMDRVGISFDAASFGLPGQSRKAIVQFRDDCEQELQEQEAKLEKIEYLISCRMGLGVELMRRTDSGGGKIVREMDMYRSVLSGLNRAMDEMKSFRIETFAVQAMSSRVRKGDKLDMAMAESYVKKCADSYRRLLTALKDTPYPFEHGEGISTVAKYLRKEVGSPEQLAAKPAGFHDACQRVEEILENLDRRMMLGVASWGIKVESHLGLEGVRIVLNKDAEPEMKEAVGQR